MTCCYQLYSMVCFALLLRLCVCVCMKRTSEMIYISSAQISRARNFHIFSFVFFSKGFFFTNYNVFIVHLSKINTMTEKYTYPHLHINHHIPSISIYIIHSSSQYSIQLSAIFWTVSELHINKLQLFILFNSSIWNCEKNDFFPH